MPLFGVAIEDFGGLDLTDAVNENSGAIDMLNVDLDVRGRMRSRDGFTKFTTTAGADVFTAMVTFPQANSIAAIHPSTSKVELVDYGTGVRGALSGATAAVNNNLVTFASPSANVLYAPTGTANQTILKCTGGGAFSNVSTAATTLTATQVAHLINVTPTDNRLMLLNLGGVSNIDGGSTIIWSGSGTPETWLPITTGPPLTGPIVQLTPGDGEAIKDVCNFANQTFVFKQTKFFVFTGTTSDAGGNPVFNYRTVDTGIGIDALGTGQLCVAAFDAVYFASSTGVYRTTGGTPQKISTAIDPLFGIGGPIPPYFQGATGPIRGQDLSFLNMIRNRLYLGYFNTLTGANSLLVYDIATQQWMYHGLQTLGFVDTQGPISGGSIFFGYYGINAPTGTLDVGKMSTAATTDAGTAITARYRAAYIDFDYSGRTIKRGYHGVEKTIRETMVDGMGTVNFRLAKQWVQPGALPAAAVLTLGTSPQVQQSRDRRAVRARSFSWQIDGTAPWTIEKLILNLRDISEPTLQRTGS